MLRIAHAARLYSFAQRPALISPCRSATISSGCSLHATSVTVSVAGTLAPWSVQSGYRDRSSMDLNFPVASVSTLRTLLWLYIASMTPFSSAVSSGRNARSCLWSRFSWYSFGFSMGVSISGLSYQSSG